MDTPNSSELKINFSKDVSNAKEKERDRRAAELATIVDRDRKRRNRTLNVLFGLFLITIALAGLVFAFGKSDQDKLSQTAKDEVGARMQEVQNQLPTVVNNEVKTVVTRTVDDKMKAEVKPTLNDFADQLASLEKQPSRPPSERLFSSAEAREIKNAVAVDLPKYYSDTRQLTEQAQRMAGQMDELMAVANAVRGETWGKDKLEITDRISALEKAITVSASQLAEVNTKLDKVLKQLNPDKDPCAISAELQSATFRSYSVKENTTSTLYDVGLKIKLKRLKDGVVRGVTVLRIESGRETVLLQPTDVAMGQTVSFQDNFSRYTLVPIFINRRVLANDFIGLAISTARKCPANSTK